MDRPKVALVNPATDIESSSIEPLGLEYIAAFLIENGIECRIYDEVTQHNVVKSILDWKPAYIGITATTALYDKAVKISRELRAKGLLTVIGGIHASIMPKEALPDFDIVVVGPGEIALLDIVQKSETKGIFTGAELDLPVAPLPARHLVDIDYYYELAGERLFYGNRMRTATIISSRGCPFSCKFCYNYTRKTRLQYNDPTRVFNEISDIQSKYGVNNFQFVNDDLLINKNHFREIANLLINNKTNITYQCQVRASSINEEICKIAYASGLRTVTIGVESGSQRMLDLLNKKSTVEMNSKAIHICKKVGLQVITNFIIASPEETLDDIEQTKQFIRNNPIDFAPCLIAVPFPGTGFWDFCVEHNLLPKKIRWQDFTISHPTLKFVPNTSFTYKQAVKLYEEVDSILEHKKSKISFKWVLSLFLRNPFKFLLQLAKSRKRILHYLRRLKT